jgi:hypothetical protein
VHSSRLHHHPVNHSPFCSSLSLPSSPPPHSCLSSSAHSVIIPVRVPFSQTLLVLRRLAGVYLPVLLYSTRHSSSSTSNQSPVIRLPPAASAHPFKAHSHIYICVFCRFEQCGQPTPPYSFTSDPDLLSDGTPACQRVSC